MLVGSAPAAAQANDAEPPLYELLPSYEQHVHAHFERFRPPTPPHTKATVRVGELAAHARIKAPRGVGDVRIGIYLDGELVHGVYGTGSACRVDFPVRGLHVRVDGCHTAAGAFKVTVANATGKRHRLDAEGRPMTGRWKRWICAIHRLSYSRAATVLGWILFIAVSLACAYLFSGYDSTTTR